MNPCTRCGTTANTFYFNFGKNLLCHDCSIERLAEMSAEVTGGILSDLANAYSAKAEYGRCDEEEIASLQAFLKKEYNWTDDDLEYFEWDCTASYYI